MIERLMREAPEALVQLVLTMQEEMTRLRADIGRLQARVEELEAQNRPPSAPFRRGEKERKSDPKKPGRKKGHPGSYRKVPEVIDEVIEVPLCGCPQCAGALEGVTPIVQYIEELPVVRPQVTRLTTYEGYCPQCDQIMRSSHARQTSSAGGCAGVQLGARALAVAAELKHGMGLTLRKTAQSLHLLGGLKVSAGGLAQAFTRMAGKLAPEDTALVKALNQAPVVHSDETSWWKNNAPASLWVFTTPGQEGLTLYRVVDHRDRVTFHDILSPNYPGLLISDCLSVYDTATDHQHKCYAHHLKALQIAERDQNPASAAVDHWIGRVRAFFTDAMAMKKQMPGMEATDVEAHRALLETRANTLFGAPRGDPAQERLRNRIAKQRDHLLTFLDHEAAEATNNLAERQLRGAVIARKLSCGNKTDRGAATWQILASLSATCTQRAIDFVTFVTPRLSLLPAG